MNPSALDLNLLVALDALLRERGVSAAAKRLGLSQPATSHALARLREVLGDPLLVRVGRTMELSPRAEQLGPEVEVALRAVMAVFRAPSPFVPATLAHAFGVAATDYVQLVLLGQLVQALAEAAPRASIHVLPMGERSFVEVLRVGEIELAIGLPPTGGATDIHVSELFRDRTVGIARKGHAAAQGKLTPANYANCQHVLVAPRGTPQSSIDQSLAKLGLSRRVVLTVPSFLVVPHIVAESDAVALVAERLARVFVRLLPLEMFEPPFDVGATRITMAWHARSHVDPAHRFFRELVRRVATDGIRLD